MLVGIITGSGTHALPDFEDAAPGRIDTPWGAADVTRGRFAGVDALHLSRHGEGHVRLSNHVNHRANIAALKEAGCAAVVGCTACGAVDGDIPLGSLVMFDDLHFLANRLRGRLDLLVPHRGGRSRARPLDLRGPVLRAPARGARRRGAGGRHRGPRQRLLRPRRRPRFNTRTEIAQLAAAGVTAVSQTAGPETVLCGEAELPYALMGFATDYANGVKDGRRRSRS